jgi:hypothetical protein
MGGDLICVNAHDPQLAGQGEGGDESEGGGV